MANKKKTAKPSLCRKLKIGVMGSASGPTLTQDGNYELCKEVGREIARQDCIMINGACPGLPHYAAEGAEEEGGFVLGVSPAFSLKEHVDDYKSPNEFYDIVIFSAMGFMERDILNIRSSDGLVFLGGGIGTINEFTVAFEEGKPMAVLKGSGGVADHILEIINFTDRQVPPNLLITEDPKELISGLIELIHKYPTPVHEDGRVTDVKFGKHRG